MRADINKLLWQFCLTSKSALSGTTKYDLIHSKICFENLITPKAATKRELLLSKPIANLIKLFRHKLFYSIL